MKYRSSVSCFYCSSDHPSEFVCSECEVYKCLECVSRIETLKALCVECLQNSADSSESKIMIRIVSPLMESRGNRILFVGGPDIVAALQNAMHALQQLPSTSRSREIVIRIDSSPS